MRYPSMYAHKGNVAITWSRSIQGIKGKIKLYMALPAMFPSEDRDPAADAMREKLGISIPLNLDEPWLRPERRCTCSSVPRLADQTL
jgi:hypothetical protein